ncbi:glycosyltransferase family 4 protein [Flavobacteriaceae bacterium]|nr:glycosyltransferase family 4 protein [Flavobacteriaceae bacterium]
MINKKILINVNSSWNVFNFRLGLIKFLQSEGYEVIALAPKDEYVNYLESAGVKCFNISLNQKGVNPITDFILFLKYLRMFNKIKPNLILSYTIKPNIYGNFAASILKIPTINNISGLGTLFIKTNFISSIGKILYKLSLKSSKHVFFQNNTDLKLFIKSRLIKSYNCSVIPGSGVKTSVFKQNKKTNKGEKFLFVGRLIGDKGVFEYLESARQVLIEYPNLEFFLAGELGYNNNTAITKTQLDNYTNCNSQIKYLGKVDDMVSLLKSIDIMVLPSYREGLSKSLIEASSMSLPIITTDVPGCIDVVENDYNGLICKVKSIKSLKNSIKKIIELSAEKRNEMGINGRKIAITKFDEKIIVQYYLKVIKKVLN